MGRTRVPLSSFFLKFQSCFLIFHRTFLIFVFILALRIPGGRLGLRGFYTNKIGILTKFFRLVLFYKKTFACFKLSFGFNLNKIRQSVAKIRLIEVYCVLIIFALFRLILYSLVLYSYFKRRLLMKSKNSDNGG